MSNGLPKKIKEAKAGRLSLKFPMVLKDNKS